MDPIYLTLFAHPSDPAPQIVGLTLREIADVIGGDRRHFRKRAKRPAFSGSLFVTGMPRTRANMAGISMFVLDVENCDRNTKERVRIDDPVTRREVDFRLQGWDYLLYSTEADQPDWPNFKILVPASRLMEPKSYQISLGLMIAHLGLEPVLRGLNQRTMRHPERFHLLPSIQEQETH